MDETLFVSFDSTQITFDNSELTWDNCTRQQQVQIIQQYLRISGGTALVVSHGENNKVYSRLDTYQDFSFSITLTNPMFNDVGSHSIPFSLPASAHNLRIFGFPARPERYTELKNKQYPFYIFAEGLHILTGVLVVTSAVPDAIECYFKSGNGEFWSAVKDKNLNSLDMGVSQEFANDDDAVDYLSDSTKNKYPDYPFVVFPVVNLGLAKDLTFDEAFAGTNGSWRGITMVNYWDVDNNNINYGRLLSEWSSISPFLYLNFVLDKLFNTNGYDIIENFIRDNSELNTLVLYNNVSKFWSDNPNAPTPIPGVRPTMIVYNEYLPAYPIANFISELEKLFCACMFINDRLKRASFKTFKEIIKAIDVLPITRVTSDIKVTVGDVYDSYTFEFANDEKLYPETDIQDLTDKFLTNPPSIPSLPLPQVLISPFINELMFVVGSDTYYVIKDVAPFTPPTYSVTWETYSRDIQKTYGVAIGKCLEISSKIFTLPAYYGAEPTNQSTYYSVTCFPLAFHRNFYELMPIDDPATADYTPRLLFYRGMQPDESNSFVIYPLGTFDVYRANKAIGGTATIQGANISLQWDGPHGLAENFYKEYLQWKMAGPDKLEFEAWLDVTQLAALDFSRKYAINHVHMLLDTVEFSITNKGVSYSKITGYKI